MEEQRYTPYPKNLQMRCHYALVEEEICKDMGDKFIWTPTDYGYEYRITERSVVGNGQYEYTIMLRTEAKDDSPEDFEPDILGFAQVPRGGIKFFNLPYTTDICLRNAFRNEIGLPDELMKDAWSNKGQKSSYQASRKTSSDDEDASDLVNSNTLSSKQTTRHRGVCNGGRTTGDELYVVKRPVRTQFVATKNSRSRRTRN
jgi:hypothetical protein